MKTAGRLTTTLLILLGLYVFGYWLLIKQNGVTKLHIKLHIGPVNPLLPNPVNEAVHKLFRPLEDLDYYWNVVIPTRKHLTGHWRADKSDDFIILSPEGECQFQLGPFAYNGKAEYDSLSLCFQVQFSHESQAHHFMLADESLMCTHGPPPPHPPHIDQANVFIYNEAEFERKGHFAYKTTLTKQASNSPAP